MKAFGQKKKSLFLLGAACLLLAFGPLPAGAAAHPENAPAPRIDAVFVLDTTGSMSGLIAAAKEKIWSIANTLASGQPTPRVRFGIVGYRDRRDEYITRGTQLTEDMDAVYASLMEFRAGGGGDMPESVNQALYEAVNDTPWDRDESTYRVVFLVGDAPPHMDYLDDVKYQQSAAAAREKGIILNAVLCGSNASAQAAWKDIARLGEGSFFSVDQNGSAVASATPYDDELVKLSGDLDKTRMFYGTAAEKEEAHARVEKADAFYEKAPAPAMAQRAAFNAKEAGKMNFLGGNELVEDVSSGRRKLNELPASSLPAELLALDEKERDELIRQRAEERREIQEQIKAVSQKRQDFLAKKVKESRDAGRGSLDVQMFESIRSQAGKKGIAFDEGPSF